MWKVASYMYCSRSPATWPASTILIYICDTQYFSPSSGVSFPWKYVKLQPFCEERKGWSLGTPRLGEKNPPESVITVWKSGTELLNAEFDSEFAFLRKKKKCYVGKQEPENIRNITTRKIKRLVLILLLTSSMEDAAVHFLTACCMAGGKSFNSAFCFKAGYSCSCHSFQHYCEEVVNSGQWMWKSMGAFVLDCFQKGEPQKGIRSHATGSKAVTWFVAHCAIPPLGAMFPFHC